MSLIRVAIAGQDARCIAMMMRAILIFILKVFGHNSDPF